MTSGKTYSSDLSHSLDAAIAAAKAQKAAVARDYGNVAEDVSLTVFDTLRAALNRAVRRYFLSILIALLPLLMLGLRAVLETAGQVELLSIVGRVVLVGLVLYLLWQAWQSVRAARGRFPIRPFRRRASSRRFDELPTRAETVTPLIVGLLAIPALFVLSFAVSLPNLALVGLIALPVVVFILMVVLRAALSRLGALGGVSGVDSVSVVLSQPAVSLASLDERIVRLTQMREWLHDDALRTMVDDVIGQQVKATARRQVVYSFIVGVISLIAGWLLSAVSPVAALANLLQR
jgi:hypothetical protein